MRDSGKSGTGIGKLTRRLAVVALVCVALRWVCDGLDGGAGAVKLPDKLGVAALALELPGAGWDMKDKSAPAQVMAVTGDVEAVPPDTPAAPDPEDDASGAGDEEKPPESGKDVDGSGPQVDTQSSGGSEAQPFLAVGTTITGAGGGYTSSGEGIYLKNRTSYDIDVEELLAKPMDFFPDSSAVLIVHTHGSEAYNPDGDDIYEPSDPSRTEDKNFNVVRVGDELEGILTGRGVTVYHDRQLYDYPSYAGSYDRALEAINAQLSAHPEIKVVIDLHRDALESDDGTVYKTVADIGDTPCAQVMLICGTNYSGLKHPDWRENLSFALKLQRQMVDNYPTLARPLKISEYRYNQHATKGSLIAEVGCNGNTLQEALTAVRYFGDCLANVLTAGAKASDRAAGNV